MSDQSKFRAEPVAWRWHWRGGDEPDVWGYSETPIVSDEHRHAEPLYASPLSPRKEVVGLDRLLDLHVNIGAETSEPSLRQMVKGYYQAAGNGYDWGLQQYEKFIATIRALAQPAVGRDGTTTSEAAERIISK